MDLLRKIIIQGKEFNLFITVRRDSSTYIFSVPLPEELIPDGLILPKLNINTLAELHINIQHDGSFYISFFYIYVSRDFLADAHIPFDVDEMALLEQLQRQLIGIGKQILCFTFSYLEKVHRFNPDDTIVKLDAAGGSRICTHDVLSQLSRVELLERLQYYPITYHETKDNSVEDIISTLCSIENNKKLIRYYEKYGFRVDDIPQESKSGIMVPMTASVSDIKKYCGELYKCNLGRRRISRRRRKSKKIQKCKIK